MHAVDHKLPVSVDVCWDANHKLSVSVDACWYADSISYARF